MLGDQHKHDGVIEYAFTEQGVAMLSTVLRSETAIRVSIRIHQMNWWKESIESNQYATFQEYEDENTIILTLCFCINSKAQCKSDYSIYENTISVLYEKLLKDKVLSKMILFILF